MRTKASLLGAVCVVSSIVVVGCNASSSELVGVILGGSTSRRTTTGDPGHASATPSSVTSSKAECDSENIGFVAAALGTTPSESGAGSCRPGMVSIEGRYCVDRYEASLVEVISNGEERPFSPFSMVTHEQVRAVSKPNVYPQGYISANQAKRACAASGKRLCQASEWQKACRGPENRRYGYANTRERGRCNDVGRNPVMALFGFRYDESTMNQSKLNQLEGTLAKTGSHAGCSNGYGVYDMVGNLHEWVADESGTFYGGYYQDVASVGHGDGCAYRTTAHEARYHDYSTGFRCCADLREAETSESHSLVASDARGRGREKEAPPRAPSMATAR